MIDLMIKSRGNEVFHLQYGKPTVKNHFDWKVIRRTSWENITKANGWSGTWVSWWFFNHLQIYYGSSKCDASRTVMYWDGILGQPVDKSKYVMTTQPEEMWAFRWRTNGPEVEPTWKNMGSS